VHVSLASPANSACCSAKNRCMGFATEQRMWMLSNRLARHQQGSVGVYTQEGQLLHTADLIPASSRRHCLLCRSDQHVPQRKGLDTTALGVHQEQPYTPSQLLCSVACISVGHQALKYDRGVRQRCCFQAVRCQQAVHCCGHACALVLFKHATCRQHRSALRSYAF
jgi:hypothetical protein